MFKINLLKFVLISQLSTKLLLAKKKNGTCKQNINGFKNLCTNTPSLQRRLLIPNFDCSPSFHLFSPSSFFLNSHYLPSLIQLFLGLFFAQLGLRLKIVLVIYPILWTCLYHLSCFVSVSSISVLLRLLFLEFSSC